MASSSSVVSKSTISKKKEQSTGTPAIENFVAEPNILDEHAIELFDKILLPAEKPYTHAFLGPLPQPIEE